MLCHTFSITSHTYTSQTYSSHTYTSYIYVTHICVKQLNVKHIFVTHIYVTHIYVTHIYVTLICITHIFIWLTHISSPHINVTISILRHDTGVSTSALSIWAAVKDSFGITRTPSANGQTQSNAEQEIVNNSNVFQLCRNAKNIRHLKYIFFNFPLSYCVAKNWTFPTLWKMKNRWNM
jgi:hypothetical protein